MDRYHDHVVPSLSNWSMRRQNLVAYRDRIVSAATGPRALNGLGSGLYLPLCSPSVGHVIGVDPSPRLVEMARVAQHVFRADHGRHRECYTTSKVVTTVSMLAFSSGIHSAEPSIKSPGC
jgi:hypothetical protein